MLSFFYYKLGLKEGLRDDLYRFDVGKLLGSFFDLPAEQTNSAGTATGFILQIIKF